MQKAIENGVVVLTADEGMKLTNGTAFGGTVRLGVNDSEDNWYEVTEAEAEKMMAAQDAEEPEDETAIKAAAFDVLMGVEE